MAEPTQPVVSLMDRMSDDSELLVIEDDADLASPNGMSSAADIMPDGIEIELDEEGGATVDFDPTAENMIDEAVFQTIWLANTTLTERLVRIGKTRILRA